MKRLLPLVFLLTACANAGTPTLDPRAAGAYFNELAKADAEATAAKYAADLITQDANEHALNQARTATAFPLELTATGQAIALQDIAITQAWDNATAEAAVRATADARAAIAIPTSAAATGTALAVYAETDKTNLESARSISNLIGLAALGFIVGMGIGCYWLIGFVSADVKRRNNLAEAKPIVVGGVLVLPPGYTQHPIVMAARALPAPAIPEIEERTIGGHANGKARFIEVSQPVNEHEKRWREILDASCFIFEQHGFSSADLCGKGKPFASPSYWMDITDRLVDNGLILKEHGAPTLPVGEWADIRARIQDATHPLKLPAYLPPNLRAFDPSKMVKLR